MKLTKDNYDRFITKLIRQRYKTRIPNIYYRVFERLGYTIIFKIIPNDLIHMKHKYIVEIKIQYSVKYGEVILILKDEYKAIYEIHRIANEFKDKLKTINYE